MLTYIGQHIFDFASKFRNKVYFENLKGSSSVLNVADNGEVTKVPTVSNIDTWHLSDTNKLALSPPEGNSSGITFKPDGTKVFTIGYSRNRVQSYDLSTAWDLTSAGSPTESEYLVQNNLSGTQEDFFIDSSGTRMYVLSRSSDSVGQFTLNTAWDISDITFVQDVHMNNTALSGGVAGFVTGEGNPMGITFKPDGTIMYIVGYTTDDVFQIPLSTAWDISTHGTVTSVDVSSEATPSGVQFNNDGTVMYIMGYSSDAIHQYNLSTAWDVTTASFVKRTTPFIRPLEGTPNGFYYNETEQKAFVCGRSSDFAYEVIISEAIRFSDPVSAELLQGDKVIANELVTGYTGRNDFFNTTQTHSTFQSNSTTYLGYNTGAQNVRVGNTVYGNYRFHVFQHNYINSDFISNPTGALPNIRFFNPLIGGVGVFSIGKTHNTGSSYLLGGVTDIESEADTFDHKGEITLGGELKVTGNQPLKYKDPNLYTQGTQIVLDNFNETTQTTLDNHTPDTGSGYTNVYISPNISFPTNLPIIIANAGYLRPAVTNANDGYRFVNDTTISTANYEARAVIRKQSSGDDPFVLFVKYIDENNYFAMHFAGNYSYCTPISVVGGTHTQHGALYYHANTSTADDVNFEVALRVVGNNVHVFYEGRYRGSREVNITGIGKAGIGFGRSNDSILTSYDLTTNAHISKFEIYELPDSLFDGSDSAHYIENGKVGIGTTSPGRKLTIAGTDNLLFLDSSGNSYLTIDRSATNRRNALAFSTAGDGTSNIPNNINWALGSADSDEVGDGTGFFINTNTSATSAKLFITSTGNVGIGTTSPGSPLTVAGRVDFQNDLRLRGTDSAANQGVTRFYVDSNNKFHIDTANDGNNLFVIDSTGRVGIGNTAPSYKLDVNAGTENIVASFISSDQTAQLRIVDGSNVPFFFGVIGTGAYISPTGATPANGISIKNTGNVGIGVASPHATALLDVSSTTKGVLFPRMTETQRDAIEGPATGLIVYQTDGTEGLYIYKSTGWTQIV